jgi:hypothetical protein
MTLDENISKYPQFPQIRQKVAIILVGIGIAVGGVKSPIIV